VRKLGEGSDGGERKKEQNLLMSLIWFHN